MEGFGGFGGVWGVWGFGFKVVKGLRVSAFRSTGLELGLLSCAFLRKEGVGGPWCVGHPESVVSAVSLRALLLRALKVRADQSASAGLSLPAAFFMGSYNRVGVVYK